MSLVEVNNLSVEFGRRRALKRAVDAVSFDIRPGETLGLVGESGSGKTTLGKAILGQVPIAAGSVVFDGEDITNLAKRDRRKLSQRVQVVFQNPYLSLNPQRTVGQSIAETLSTRTDLSSDEVRSRVIETLDLVGIAQSAVDKFPAAFSGGQRQRIAIARALLPRPDLIICDEAVSALDLSIQAQVLNVLVELQDQLGLAYLFITHDISVVTYLCHRVVVLRNGSVVESGNTAEVCDNPQQEYTQKLLGAAPIANPDAQALARAARASLSSPPAGGIKKEIL